MIYNIIARVVSKQQVHLAAFLIDKHKEAKEHRRFRDGRITFRDFARFSNVINDSRTRNVSQQIQDSENSDRRSSFRKNARSRLLQNRLKLWVRFDKRLIVEGVLVGDRVVSAPHDMSEGENLL